MSSAPQPRKTARISDSLNRQLNAYALVASAAGVSVLALAGASEAKVVYTKTHRVKHRPDAPSPEQVERERAAERKRIQKGKLAITTRHRILATIPQRTSAPLKKADLQIIAQYIG